MTTHCIPNKQLARTVIATFRERGERWLRDLPAEIDGIAAELEIELLPAYPNLSYSYAAPATGKDGRELVLKLCVPNPELTCEIEALRLFAGCGAARLHYADAERGVVLLERLIPGGPLTGLAGDDTDTTATSAACAVLRGLHRAAPSEQASRFASLQDLAQGFSRLRHEFGGATGPFPASLIDRAEKLWSDLTVSAGQQVLLHGDLHHDNIISATREPWLAIDPKGYVGDPAFDTGPLIRNLWQDRCSVSNPKTTIERRIGQMADELDFDVARVRGWAVAQAALSAWWCYEDGQEWVDAVEMAEMIGSAT